MKCAHVVIDIPTQSLDKEYTYSIPDSLENCQVGCSVLVSFGPRQAIAFVMEISDQVELEDSVASATQLSLFGEDMPLVSESTSKKSPAYKPILQVLTPPLFTSLGAQCARFLAFRYVAPLSSCVRLLTPPGGVPKIQRIQGKWEITHPIVSEVDDRFVKLTNTGREFVPRKNAAKQRMILDALVQGELRVAELTAEYGSVSAALKSLEEKGAIEIEFRRRYRGNEGVNAAFASRAFKPDLTIDQQKALDKLTGLYNKSDGQVAVLDGVTGSGKTEVYLCLIEKVLDQGKNAIVLVPEISLTPQTVARFRGRFGNTVAVLHSRMSDGERFDQWDLIRQGKARVVVGARSALFAPLADVGVIIIDEEHEGSYKQDQAPRYVTRDVAGWFAKSHGALLVLGSATPAIESLYACETQNNWTRIEMLNRANGKPLPPIEIVDMSKEFGGGNKHMFSKRLQSELFKVLQKKQKAVLLLNQRGFAQFMLCRDCGFVPECPSCSTSLTYHEVGQKLVCHHCGYTVSAPNRCPQCGSPYLKKFGAGTQRVESELRQLLSDISCTIIRMDSDTTSRKGAHQKLLEQFAQADAAVLLGTQMIAKGLDFDDVTLVGVINADTMLKLPDFRASERTFDLIEQVAGRSGRADLDGHVLVQTYNASHYAIQAAAHYRRDYFLEHDLSLREQLGYPPFTRLANVLVWGKDEKRVIEVGQQLFKDLDTLLARPSDNKVEIYPPTACVLSKLKGTYRYHLLIKMFEGFEIEQLCNDYFRKRKPQPDVQVSLDIDPTSLL